MERQKGKAAVEVGQLNKLPAILRPIKDAVLVVELDAEIGLIAKERAECRRSSIPHVVDYFQTQTLFRYSPWNTEIF